MSNIKELEEYARIEARTDAENAHDHFDVLEGEDLDDAINELWHESEVCENVTPASAREKCRVAYVEQFLAWPMIA